MGEPRGDNAGMGTTALPLLLRLFTSDHTELARQVQYLQAENRVLRSKLPRCVRLTERERRRLVRLGLPVGAALRDLIAVVHYDTFRRWCRGEKRKARQHRRKPGRPQKPVELQELVLRLARETGWGYSRLIGELRKLGVRSISRATVRNILKRHGIEPAPERGDHVWSDFLKRHAETLWACDFLTKRVLTPRGIRSCTVLAFMHIKTRRCERAGSGGSTFRAEPRCATRTWSGGSARSRRNAWITLCPSAAGIWTTWSQNTLSTTTRKGPIKGSATGC